MPSGKYIQSTLLFSDKSTIAVPHDLSVKLVFNNTSSAVQLLFQREHSVVRCY